MTTKASRDSTVNLGTLFRAGTVDYCGKASTKSAVKDKA